MRVALSPFFHTSMKRSENDTDSKIINLAKWLYMKLLIILKPLKPSPPHLDLEEQLHHRHQHPPHPSHNPRQLSANHPPKWVSQISR